MGNRIIDLIYLIMFLAVLIPLCYLLYPLFCHAIDKQSTKNYNIIYIKDSQTNLCFASNQYGMVNIPCSSEVEIIISKY